MENEYFPIFDVHFFVFVLFGPIEKRREDKECKMRDTAAVVDTTGNNTYTCDVECVGLSQNEKKISIHSEAAESATSDNFNTNIRPSSSLEQQKSEGTHTDASSSSKEHEIV